MPKRLVRLVLQCLIPMNSASKDATIRQKESARDRQSETEWSLEGQGKVKAKVKGVRMQQGRDYKWTL